MGLTFEVCAPVFEFLGDGDVFFGDDGVGVPFGCVRGIGVGERTDTVKAPEDGVPGVGAVAVFVGDSYGAEAFLVDAEVACT